jgi:hypothetical protein
MRILRVVGSGVISCGCFVGLYETYHGPTVQIIEEQGVRCVNPGHQPGHLVSAPGFASSVASSGQASAAQRTIQSH